MKSTMILLLITFALSIGVSAQEDYKDKRNLKEHYTNPEKHEVSRLPEKSIPIGTKPRNIILMIGDGMGTAQLFAAYTANGGALNITNLPYSGFSTTQSADDYTTDSAAGGTALSTGQRTYNGAIAVDVNKKPIPTILEIAEKHGKATGLVSSSAITHATPASFIAHNVSRNNYEEIAADFLKTDIDIFIGGGKSFFEERKDGRNLLKELEEKNYRIFDSLSQAENYHHLPMAILTAPKHNPTYPERGKLVQEGTAKAIKALDQDEKGYFLMVEGSQVDWGGHENNTAYIIKEMLDFDKAVGKALELAAGDGETLIIVTADHETGGMSIESGNFEKGEVHAKYTTGNHTGIMVPVFAVGPGAEHFTGIMKNTDIFHKMMYLFGFDE
ncbi:alkaline phosphatase [Marinilabilia salmonicolor]|jgi:alkaline phosphatase|uniref:Alkaline phosphatase n=1 Tax=Marinilabilia salmonicolor TaxID=989 RepID=A0A368UPX0_9BACT|nr:alkaline phosphatase [Marinilabilia salmonicolor]RCW30867.1 alkaline phosphatase [Marinilabilia salmonicolor]